MPVTTLTCVRIQQPGPVAFFALPFQDQDQQDLQVSLFRLRFTEISQFPNHPLTGHLYVLF